MAKVRLKHPVTGRFHWVEESQIGAPESEPAPAASSSSTQDNPPPPATRQTARPKRGGAFDDDDDVEDWDLDDL